MKLKDEAPKAVKDTLMNLKVGADTKADLKKLQAAYPEWSVSKIIRACIRTAAQSVKESV